MSTGHEICLLGFGEVGQRLARDLGQAEGLSVSAWDIAFEREGSAPLRALPDHPQVRPARSAQDAAEGAELVISAVTAAEDLAAAQSVAPALQAGCWFLDLNSVSPGTRRLVADVVAGAGGRYVEAAVMSPIAPRGMGSPMLLGGEGAEAFMAAHATLGFAGARPFSPELGRASAAKMCRSVLVKGMEALLCEALVAARRHSVEADVLASLGNLLPHEDWTQQSRYMISRALGHGLRRAQEMEEVATTLREVGVEPLMSEAAGERQSWAAGLGEARTAETLAGMLDAMTQLERKGGKPWESTESETC